MKVLSVDMDIGEKPVLFSWRPEPTLDSLKLPVTPAPRDQMPPSAFLQSMKHMLYTQINIKAL